MAQPVTDFDSNAAEISGTYVTAATAFYAADIAASIQFGGITINAGAHVEGFSSALSLLYVPERKLWSGNLGLSVTVPVGHIAADATVVAAPLPPISREVDGWGLGDVVTRAQLGWQQGDFSHTSIFKRSLRPGAGSQGSHRSWA